MIALSGDPARSGSCFLATGESVLIDGESLDGWSIEADAGASAGLALVPGRVGNAVELQWTLGSGQWVQAKHTFGSAIDLGAADVFRVDLRGGAAAEVANTVALMFADTDGVFFGIDLDGSDDAVGLNQIDRWMGALVLPKKVFYHFFSIGTTDVEIDWTSIDRFFVVLKRPHPAAGGGSGLLAVDVVAADVAAAWPRPATFDTPSPQPAAAAAALAYLRSAQDPLTGLLVSWKEEELENPPPKAWLYDQALGLIALSRDGAWVGGVPQGDSAAAADGLAGFLVAAQKPDGHWARGWNPRTAAELVDDGWVGDQAWAVLGLVEHSARSGAASSQVAAEAAAEWLAAQIHPDGSVVASTEGNADVWWAMTATGRVNEAASIETHLATAVWDPEVGYWWRGVDDPLVALDTATWLAELTRHVSVDRRDRGLAALGFVARALRTTSVDGTLCGQDGQGPIHLWNEGTAQFVSAGGEGLERLVDDLLVQQRPDGSMPGSTADATSDFYGWWSTWSGVAPTAWLHFALTRTPFPQVLAELFLDGFESGDTTAWAATAP